MALFTPPHSNPGPRPARVSPLLRFYLDPPQGISVGITRSGAVEEFAYKTQTEVSAYAQVFLGGHVTQIDSATQAVLTSAGYGASISEPTGVYGSGRYGDAIYA